MAARLELFRTGFKLAYASRHSNFEGRPGATHAFFARYVLAPRVTLEVFSQGRKHCGELDVDFIHTKQKSRVDHSWWLRRAAEAVKPTSIPANDARYYGNALSVLLETEGSEHTARAEIKTWSRDWTTADDLAEGGFDHAEALCALPNEHGEYSDG